MLKKTLLIACISCLAFTLSAQDYRSIDGTGNNIAHPEWGAAGTQLRRLTTIGYRDGISNPGGITRPNARLISNELFAQDSLLSDPLNLSDYTWVFGQFIDHDITAVPNSPTESAAIPVSFADPYMNPGGHFTVFIPMNRSQEADGTGTSVDNPREHFNNITAFIDGSAVYGSDIERANWLRSFVGGKLKTSTGNLLPFNTVTGELDDPIDPAAPFMDNENPFVDKLFIAGDSRANENPLLTSMHTLFVREHNRLCDELAAENPGWDDEQLYQKVRKIVGALMQAITYEAWLPAMGVHLPSYTGYNDQIDPGISNVFSAAAYRLGHTLLNSTIVRMDNDGEIIPQGNLSLKDAFFNPMTIVESGDIDVFFKGMAVQIEQDMDSKVVDDVRNFLFGPPGSGLGGLDLAAININRGRERGLPDFNTVRQDFGLLPLQTCSSICSDPEVYNVLQDLYGDVNTIDPWVGMVAEQHMSNALFGETIMTIMHQQFGNLRDGDRYYYENDLALAVEEIEEIRSTTLQDIIMRNTGVTVMQPNVFIAMPHDMVCSTAGEEATIGGQINTRTGNHVADVNLQISWDTTNVEMTTSDENGEFAFADLETCTDYEITPSKDINPNSGVTTFDIVVAQKHILNFTPFSSPYQFIAADVNQSGSITSFDLVEIRKLILGIIDGFSNNSSWKFVDAAYTFTDPADALNGDYPESVLVPSLEAAAAVSFVGVKIGDVNGSATGNNLLEASGRTAEAMVLEVADQYVQPGQQLQIPFFSRQIGTIVGFQFTLDYDASRLEFVDAGGAALPAMSKTNFGHFAEAGKITGSWNGQATAMEEEALFYFSFEAKKAGKLSEMLELNSSVTEAEAYDKQLAIREVSLQFAGPKPAAATDLQLYQNQPNPFRGATEIAFFLPQPGPVSLQVFDVAGKEVYRFEGPMNSGYHIHSLDAAAFGKSGVLYYQLSTDSGKLTRKMVRVE